MKKIYTLLFGLTLVSCATTSNDAVKKSLTNINEELLVIQKSLNDTQTNVEDLQSSTASVLTDIATNADAISSMRSEIAYLNNEIMVLKGRGSVTNSSSRNSNLELSRENQTDNQTMLNNGNSLEKMPKSSLNGVDTIDDNNQQIIIIEDSTADKNSIYTYAGELFKQKKYTDARGKYQEFIDKYPKDKLAVNSLYWIGETYYSIGDMKNALKVFKSIPSDYPDTLKVPDALLKVGFTYNQQGKRKEAVSVLQDLVKRYPKSKPATLAKSKLKSWGY